MSFLIALIFVTVGMMLVKLAQPSVWTTFFIGWLFGTLSLMAQHYWRTGGL